MISVRIERMMVIVAVAVIVAVSVGVTVVVGCLLSIGLTDSCAFQIAHHTAVCKTFDMVMMTFLCAAHVLLESKNLGSVLAE